MSDLSKESALVCCHGPFVWVAQRMARDLDKVYYYNPWEEAFSKVDKVVIGDGYPDIIRVKEPWDVLRKGKVDFAVFTDIHHPEMQELIDEDLGIPVWGARHAEEMELNKDEFRDMQRRLGADVPDYHVIEGLENLREFCKDPKNDGCFIKLTPQYRGSVETFRHVNYMASRKRLDSIGYRHDVIQDVLRFLIEKPIKSTLEGGCDTYCVRGQIPDEVIQGYEKKDKGYFAAVIKYKDLPEELRRPLEPILPEFKRCNASQMLSTEVKIMDNKKSILLEPTIRFPSPAGEEQAEMMGNFTRILRDGAHGKLTQPDWKYRFACEAMMEHDDEDKSTIRSLNVPKEVEQWTKLYSTTLVNGRTATAPGERAIGAVIGVGDSPKDALEHLKENVEYFKDEPVTIHLESIPELLVEIEEAQKKGVKFTDKALPKPADAVAS